MNRKPPVIFEDGLQTRDYVHVRDIIQANLLAMTSDKANYEVFNVGTGRATSILDVARILMRELGVSFEPEVTSKFRAGDIRHCFASVEKIRSTLGFSPSVNLGEGVRDLVVSIRKQVAGDRFDIASKELAARNLLR